MTVPITPLRPFGLDATAAFVDENRYHQARTWPFERDGNRLLLSGASRRVAPRPTERLSASGWDFVLWVRLGRSAPRSEEHTSELQSLMRTSYAVFCLIKNTGHIRFLNSQSSI